jgi:hypothetical protein
MNIHLKECLIYQQFLLDQTANSIVKKRRINPGEEEGPQATISDQMTPARYLRANELAALMVYQAGLPLGFFEKPEILAFLRVLNSAYISPKRDLLSI